jgi:hypothetical protein
VRDVSELGREGEPGALGTLRRRAPSDVAAPIVDIVIPVYNETVALPAGVRRLHDYLAHGFPFSWRVTIVDNGSTDGTWFAAGQLARELTGVRAVHLDAKGRGRALRSAWSTSDAAVLAYMDVDLSTDLDALLPLLAPLVSGHSDLAIGSRLAPGASVARSARSSRARTTSCCARCCASRTGVAGCEPGDRSSYLREVVPFWTLGIAGLIASTVAIGCVSR